MRATFLKEIPTNRDMLSTFLSYDGRARAPEGSFADMLNLSSRNYPIMSTRSLRAWLKDVGGIQGVLCKDRIAWVADNKFYYNGELISELEPTEAERTVVSMGNYVVIYPDQVRYNPAEGTIEKMFLCVGAYTYSLGGDWPTYLMYTTSQNSGEWSYGKYDVNGDGYLDGYYIRKTVASKTYEYPDGDSIILKISAYENFDTDTNYNSEGDAHTYLSATGEKLYNKLAAWDGELEFCRGINEYYKCKPIEIIKSETFDNFPSNGPYLLIKIPFVKISQNEFIKQYGHIWDARPSAESDDFGNEVKWRLVWPPRKPLDGVFESGNRLWGYRYGKNAWGDFVNEVYSTALGEPIAWDTFEGIASDSYAVSIGTDGPFTGAIEYSGSLYFFKENSMHRLIGSKPSNYQLSTLSCHGVERGSERSLVILGDSLYYKGDDGIYCYDGSIPYRISDVFGERRYKNAVGGVLGSRVFMDMEDAQGRRVIFVYDTLKRLWHIEESVRARAFIPAYGNLMYMNDTGFGLIDGEAIDESITEVFGESIVKERSFEWLGEFNDFGLSDPDAKYVSKLQLRMTVEEGARVTVEIMTDSSGFWETAEVFSAQNKRSVCLPIVTPRCDHFRIRLSGEGGFKLWSLTKETESTNEVR